MQCGETTAETCSHIPAVCEIREEFGGSSHERINKAIGTEDVEGDGP